jgi:hypothetical protein
MPAVARQSKNGECCQGARQSEPGKGPPHGLQVEAEMVRQILVDPDLDLVHQFQEAPDRGGDDKPDQAGEYQQRAVLPAPDQSRRISLGR